MERIICVLIGYVFGIFQTGYLYGKLHNIDIRTKGSGNAGTTNALRTMGLKAGVVTFLGDAFKCIFAVVLVKAIYAHAHADALPMLAMYAGMGAVLGHNYPFYLNFKGGKGIAVTAGLLASTLPLGLVIVCLLSFAIPVIFTKYVSVGSIVVVTVYLISVIVYGQAGGFGVSAECLMEMYLIAVFLLVSAVFRHRANIKRLINGTENKISIGKRKKQ